MRSGSWDGHPKGGSPRLLLLFLLILVIIIIIVIIIVIFLFIISIMAPTCIRRALRQFLAAQEPPLPDSATMGLNISQILLFYSNNYHIISFFAEIYSVPFILIQHWSAILRR